jgi:uncharacterized membrane protein YqjE
VDAIALIAGEITVDPITLIFIAIVIMGLVALIVYGGLPPMWRYFAVGVAIIILLVVLLRLLGMV